MKRKLILIIIFVLFLTGCTSKPKKNELDYLAIKEMYEVLNNSYDINGKKYNKVEIPEDNPFKLVDINYILDLCKNKKSFYLYTDSPTNQWGRSAIKSLIEKAKENNIDTIYYLDLVHDRDLLEYRLKTTAIIENGTFQYQQLLEYLKDTLPAYILYDGMGDFAPAEEGRINDGNIFYVKDGNGVLSYSPRSVLQLDYFEEQDANVINDLKKNIQDFFDAAEKGDNK